MNAMNAARVDRLARLGLTARRMASDVTGTTPLWPLGPKQRRHLRSLGHHLSALIQVGKDGVTPAVSAALAQALRDHELVKVRLLETCTQKRPEVATALAAATSAAIAGEIGRTILFYKPHPEKPRIVLPPASPAL